MNFEAAVDKFVQDNYRLLVSETLERDHLKRVQRKFFIDGLKNKHGNPARKDIQVALVKFLKKRGVSPETIGAYIEALPIFKEAGEQTIEHLHSMIKSEDLKPSLTSDELAMLEKVRSYEAVKEFRSKEIEAEAKASLRKYDDLIEERRAEYENLPSVLDKQSIPEPAFDPQVENVKRWWERFYLRADPFARKDGLSSVPQEMYDLVIVKTDPFQKTLGALQSAPEYLFHTGFLLVGDFGYGKTTFIDYLGYHLIHMSILPIRITSGKSFPDSTGFINNFYLRLRDELKKEFAKISSEPTDFLFDLEIDTQIIELLQRICQSRWNGVVIFLDDYHKHRTQQANIFEFIGLLQILKDNLSRAGLNVGFVVSGTREWKTRWEHDGQMSGFLDSAPVEMPNITPSLVCEVFNNRISAFCYDATPRTIKVEFVERVFQDIRGQAGYRDYISRIVSELSNDNFAIINTPIEISRDVLDNIKAELEKDGSLKKGLSDLVFRSSFQKYTQEQVAKCLDLLIQTGMHEGVSEQDKLFLDNSFYFRRLLDVGLIQKSRVNLGEREVRFKWVLHAKLKRAAESVREKHRLGLNDYLLKIYGRGDAAKPRLIEETAGELAQFREYFRKRPTISQSSLDNIMNALQDYDAFVSASQASSGEDRQRHIKRGKGAIDALSRAFFELDKSSTYFRRMGIREVEEQWSQHWLQDEGLTEMFKRYDDFIASSNSMTYNMILKQIKDVFPQLAGSLLDLTREICEPGSLGLKLNNIQHSPDEVILFSDVSQNYLSGISDDHFQYTKKVTDFLERKIRTFLYVTCILVYGDKYVDNFPSHMRQYAFKNTDSSLSYGAFDNRFDGLTRPMFKQIFAQGNSIRDLVLCAIDLNWQTSDWDAFFNAFADYNINTAHQKIALFSASERSKYIAYCHQAEQLTAALNVVVRDIVLKRSYMIYDGDSEEKNLIFKYAFKKASPDSKKGDSEPLPSSRTFDSMQSYLIKAAPADHRVDPSIIDRVWNTLGNRIESTEKNYMDEDLMDVEYIVNTYNVSYVEFISSLACLHFVRQKLFLTPWFGSRVMIVRHDKG